MRSSDKIKRYFTSAELRINQDADEKVFIDVTRARQEITKNASSAPESIWRIVTKSPLAKVTVAAVLTIAGLTGLFLLKSTGSGIALADVLDRIEQTKAYRYEMSMTVTGHYIDGKPIHLEAHFTALASREYGVRIKCETSPLPINGQRINQEMYILPSQRTITTLMPDDKTYSQIEFDETSLERMSREYNDPRFVVRQILACKHTRLGKSVIDGVEVERFQTTDPSFFGNAFGQAETKIEIWVDVGTHLPMRLELEANKDDTVRIHALAYDFQWDVSVDAAEFEPVIPDDYMIGQPPMIIGP